MSPAVQELIRFIESKHGIGNKESLIASVVEKFALTKDRTVYCSQYFAIRFSYSARVSFSNTVLSLSHLQKYDHLPFIVCVITPQTNYCYLANSSFLIKISHSSHELREDNIKGSFNGSDIMKWVGRIENTPENFKKLFAFHTEMGFSENLPRLVEATHNITPSIKHYEISEIEKTRIFESINRAYNFIDSREYVILKNELNQQVKKI